MGQKKAVLTFLSSALLAKVQDPGSPRLPSGRGRERPLPVTEAKTELGEPIFQLSIYWFYRFIPDYSKQSHLSVVVCVTHVQKVPGTTSSGRHVKSVCRERKAKFPTVQSYGACSAGSPQEQHETFSLVRAYGIGAQAGLSLKR